jgi:cell division protein FtsB
MQIDGQVSIKFLTQQIANLYEELAVLKAQCLALQKENDELKKSKKGGDQK